MKRLVSLTTLGFASLLAHTASAQLQDQTWLDDRRFREGEGVRVGDFELHPGIGVDLGYDSNFYRRAPSEEPVGSLRFRAAPHFSVSTLGAQRRGDGPPPALDFRFDIAATYNEFIPLHGGQSEADRDSLQEQRNLGGSAGLELGILQGREWSGRITGGVDRTIRPANSGDVNFNFNRIAPNATADLTWAPGSGLLDWTLGYGFNGTFFEDPDAGGLNNAQNTINTRGRWRFLPRTALVYDASFGFILYTSGDRGGAGKSDSFPLRSRIGINGLFTPSFGLLAMVGWGASFYTAPPGQDTPVQDFDSVIGQLEAKFYLDAQDTDNPLQVSGSSSSVAIGFVRDFEDSFIGTYLERNFGYARFDYLFAGQFLLVAKVQGGAVLFPSLPPAPAAVNFTGPANGWTDARVDANLFGEWRVQDWLGINADIGYTGYFSGTTLAVPPDPNQPISGGNAVDNELRYQIFQAFLGVRAFL